MVMNKLNIAVIGTGYLGKYHLDKYLGNKNVRVKWVIDKDIKNTNLSLNKSIKVSTDFRDVVGDIDAASIVTPTNTHYEIARYLLDNGIHILLEKPMTETLLQAKKLNSLAQRKNVCLQIGHLERFNPVMKNLTSIVKNPVFIEVHRLAKFNPRSNDVNVVFDLMIHDIDIILSLTKKQIKKIHVYGKKIITKTTDIANVRIEFDDKSVANLTSSRISTKNERKIRIFEKDKYYSVDFLKSELTVFSKSKNRSKGLYNQKEYKYKKADALRDEIKNFVNSCLGKEKPLVDGVMGMKALKVADEISRKL